MKSIDTKLTAGVMALMLPTLALSSISCDDTRYSSGAIATVSDTTSDEVDLCLAPICNISPDTNFGERPENAERLPIYQKKIQELLAFTCTAVAKGEATTTPINTTITSEDIIEPIGPDDIIDAKSPVVTVKYNDQLISMQIWHQGHIRLMGFQDEAGNYFKIKLPSPGFEQFSELYAIKGTFNFTPDHPNFGLYVDQTQNDNTCFINIDGWAGNIVTPVLPDQDCICENQTAEITYRFDNFEERFGLTK